MIMKDRCSKSVGRFFIITAIVTTVAVTVTISSKRIPLGVYGEWVWRYTDAFRKLKEIPELKGIKINRSDGIEIAVHKAYKVLGANKAALKKIAVKLNIPSHVPQDINSYSDFVGQTNRTFWDRAWLPAAFFAIFVLLLVTTLRKVGEMRIVEEVLVVLLLVIFAWPVQLGIIHLGKGSLNDGVYITLSPGTGGYYAKAYEIRYTHPQKLRKFLASYDQYIKRLEVKGMLGHIADHPPGAILFHWYIDEFLARNPSVARFILAKVKDYLMGSELVLDTLNIKLPDAALAGVWVSVLLFPLFSCLTIVPVYLLARLSYSKTTALYAAGLCAVIPSLHLFGPYIDQLFPFLAVLLYLIFVQAIERNSFFLAMLGGMVAFIALSFSLAFLAIGGMILIAAIHKSIAILEGDTEHLAEGVSNIVRLKEWWQWILGGATGFFGVVILARLLIGYKAMNVWMICMRKHGGFAEIFDRTYWKWVIYNPIDFFLFLGVPASFLFVKTVAAMFIHGRRGQKQELRKKGKGFIHRISQADSLTVSLLAILAFLNFSGKNLGEVGRLWMFLMPFACILSATVFDSTGQDVLAGAEDKEAQSLKEPSNSSLARTKSQKTYLVLLGAQFVQVVVFKLVLDVFSIY